ncbi:MAG: phage baseplate assembly protein V [Prevotella sp.]
MNNIVIFSDYVYNTSVMSKLLGDIAEDASFSTCAFTDKQGNTVSGNDGNAFCIPSYGDNNFSRQKSSLLVVGSETCGIDYRANENDAVSLVSFYVTGITYDKKVFQPCELSVTLSIKIWKQSAYSSNVYVQAIKECFFNENAPKSTDNKTTQKRPATVSVVGVIDYGDLNTIEPMRNYQLTKIAVKYVVCGYKLWQKGSTIYVTLKCYSPDKAMTLNKYSKVYGGLQFGTEIFGFEARNRFKFKENEVAYNAERLQFLNDYGKNMDDETPMELPQPYLVQYNESFYDFIRRVAVRCGEFLYYENGVLCLGLKKGVLNNEKTLDGDDYIISYADLNNEESIGISVDCFERDYTKVGKCEGSQNETTETMFVPSYVDDEQQHRVSKANDYIADRSPWISDLAYTNIGNTIATAKAISDVATGVAVPVGKEVAMRVLFPTDSETAFDSLEKKYAEEVGIDRAIWIDDDTKVTIKDSTGEKFLNKFYSEIERLEKVVDRGTVCIDYADKIPNLMLGDALQLNNGLASNYIVTRLHGSISSRQTVDSTPFNSSHKIEAVPVLAATEMRGLKLNGDAQTYILPPHLNIPHTLNSSGQEAVVVETKDPLQIGRVRVRYIWQTATDTLSPWIRVVVPFTVGGGGMMMTPAIGDHVMINYADNNIERPYVAGFLYTSERYPCKGDTIADNRINYKYTSRSITSQNGHGITFNDSTPKSFLNFLIPPLAAVWNIADIGRQWNKDNKDQEEIDELEKALATAEKEYGKDQKNLDKRNAWEQARKDLLEAKARQANDTLSTMNSMMSNPLNGSMVLKDANGMYEVNLSSSKRSVKIRSPFGNVELNAFTGIKISAPNGDVKIEGKNVSIEAGNNLTIKGGTNIVDKPKTYFGTISSTILSVVGASAVAGAEAGLEKLSPNMKKMWDEAKNFTDLTFIRSCWEIIMRPVEGTLTIQSKRNVVMVAGLGKAWLPTSLLSKSGTSIEPNGWSLKNIHILEGEEASQKSKYFNNKGFAIISLLREVKQEVNNFYFKLSKDIYHIHMLEKAFDNCRIFSGSDAHNIMKEEIVNKILDSGFDLISLAWNDELKLKDKDDLLKKEFKSGFFERKNEHEKMALEFIETYNNLVEALKVFKEQFSDTMLLYKNIKRHWERDYYTNIGFVALKKSDIPDMKAVTDNYFDGTVKKFREIVDDRLKISSDKSKKVMRQIMCAVINGFKGARVFDIEPGSVLDTPASYGNIDDEQWQKAVESIVPHQNTDDELASDQKQKMKNELITSLLGPLAAEFGVQVDEHGSWSVPGVQGLLNWKGAAGPRAFSEYTGAGNILLSNNKGFTYKLDDDSAGFEAMRNPDLQAVKEYLSSLFKATEPLVVT